MAAQAKSAGMGLMAAERAVGGGAGAGAENRVATETDVRVRVFEGHGAAVYRVAMPEDGRFALTTGDDGTLRRWDLEGEGVAGAVIHQHKQRHPLVGLAVTADGKRAAAGDCDGGIRLFDLATGQALKSWQAHKTPGDIGGIAFLGEGQHLVSANGDAWLRRWSFDTGEKLGEVRAGFTLGNVAASADGRRVVGAGAGLALGSAADANPPVHLPEEVAFMAPVSVTASGGHAWTGTRSGQVVCWNLDERRRVATLEGHAGAVHAVAVTPDGRLVASGGADATVRLWAADTGQCLAVLSGHTSAVNHVALTPDGRRLASASIDGTLRVWDVPDEVLGRAATTRKRGYMNAKVVLVGDSGVGKSGLALRLWHDRWNATESTHGMEIQRLVLPGADSDPEVMREIWLWDLAGQPDYRLTHQIFMDQTALALLVFDPQDDKLFETVGYWQKALEKVAGKERVLGILVAGRCDRPGLRWTVEEVREWAATRGLHGPVLTAAKDGTHGGVAELRALMEELLPWEKMEFRSTTESFSALKDAILKLRGDAEAQAQGGVVVTPA